MTSRNDTGLSNHPIVVIVAVVAGIVGIISGCVSIYIFVSGVHLTQPEIPNTKMPTLEAQNSSTVTVSPSPTQLMLPAAPTPTLIPTIVVPTSVPTPTQTAVPPTPIPTARPTQPPPTKDTRLEVGQTWTGNGVSLTLDNAVLTLKGGNWSPGTLGVSFVFRNNVSNNLIFQVSWQNFYYTDNLGNVGDSLGWGWQCYRRTWGFDVPAGGTLRTIDCQDSGPGGGLSNELYDRLLWFKVDITNQAIREATVTVREFSRISNVRWRVPIPH